MKKFDAFFEGFVILFWCILLLIHSLSSLLSLIYGYDYSPSNNVVISIIVFGFLQNQIMIKLDIQNNKKDQ